MSASATSARVVVRVLLFAQLRSRLGADALSVPLPSGSTAEALMRWLAQRDPTVADLLSVSRLAVNGEYAPLERALQDGDEVAVIPPVSGG